MNRINALTVRIALPLIVIIVLFGILFSLVTLRPVVIGSLIFIALLFFILYLDRSVTHQLSEIDKALDQTLTDSPRQWAYERSSQPSLADSTMPSKVAGRQAAQMQLQLASVVFEHSQEGIMITDTRNTILNINPAFTQVTGYAAEECIGKDPGFLKSGKHDAVFYQEMQRVLNEAGAWQGEIWNRRKDGAIHPHWLNINTIKNERGEPTHYVTVFHDITDIKQTQEQMTYNAYHDALTDIPNRQLFQDHLEMAIAQAKRHKYEIGVMFLDLDKFKDVNDSFGHNVGDLLLQEAAKRLKNCCRGADTVARLSGDEFMIILPELKRDGQDAMEVAQRILKAFSQPFQLQGHEILSTVSIGIAIYPTDGEDVVTLEQNADTAMYRAKEQGRNMYVLYTKTMHDMVVERLEMENSLRKAIESEELRVYYQPQVDVRTGAISGTEALVRWQRSKNELIQPDRFIPLAEETGLIVPLGEWVLRKACEQTKAWHDNGFDTLTVSVNLSAKQFQDEHLAQVVQHVLEDTGLPPEFLYLEITESTLMKDIDAAVKIMSELHEIGVHLSIDDFGTGYSSLSSLKYFPLNELKIDKSFVKELPDHPDDVAIAKAILSLSHNLNLKVMAEGIETQTQLDFMKQNECNGIQGYLFSKPVNSEELIELLKQRKPLS